MIRSITRLIFATGLLALTSCRTVPTATAVSTPDVEAIEPEANASEMRSISSGDPQNNSAVAVIMTSTLGGNPGLYISKQMDVQAEDIGQTEMKGARILRIGEGIKITFDGSVMFAENSSTLSPVSKKNIERIAAVVTKYNNTKIVIEGHTDGTGSSKRNQELSLKRANAVSKYLSQHGVPPTKIDVVGYGEKYPLFSNTSSEGRIQNRRVEVIIVADDKLKEEAKNKYQ